MNSLSGMKIALIFPSYRSEQDPASLGEVKKNLGIIPPLSLAYVAAILERSGCTVKIIDASALNMTQQETVHEIDCFMPDFLGFTLTTVDFRNTLRWIRYLKQETQIPVLVGGIHMSAYPKETLTHPEIEYGIIGDAEETLPELLTCLMNRGDLHRVKGICYREGNEIVVTERRAPVDDLDTCPFPARHLLAHDRYYSLISKKKNFTAMMTSRGCPFRCIFCDSQTIAYRCRSPQNIVDEMEQCQTAYNINEIDMFDAVFSTDPERVREICRIIKERQLTIDWSFRTRADLVTPDMLSELKEAGCIRIYYGIESGDEVILKNINKHIDLDTIRTNIRLTRKKGIATFGYFMIGNIGETKETIKKTLTLMLQLPLDHVQILPAAALPNTALYGMLLKKLKTDYWRDYTLGLVNLSPLPTYGTALKDTYIKRIIRVCYLRFYCRVSHVIKFIIRLKTPHECFRALNALRDIFLGLCRSD